MCCIYIGHNTHLFCGLGKQTCMQVLAFRLEQVPTVGISLVRVRLYKNMKTLHIFALCTLEFYQEKLTDCLMLAFAGQRYSYVPFPDPRSLLVTGEGLPQNCLSFCLVPELYKGPKARGTAADALFFFWVPGPRSVMQRGLSL